MALRVKGTLYFSEKPYPFCYKYSPWTGKRPSGVPLFVPCDFDHRRHVTISIPSISSTAIVNSPAVSIRDGDGGPGQESDHE